MSIGVRFLVVYGINVLALIVVDWLFDSVAIGRWGSLLLGALILTIGNVVLKPILAILTLPLIIVTFGLAYFALNVLMLALAEWVSRTSHRRLLDVCRGDDRRLARERRRRLAARPRLG